MVPYNAIYTEEKPNIPRESIASEADYDSEIDDPVLVPGNTPIVTKGDLERKRTRKKQRPKEWGGWSVINFVIAYFLAIIPIYFLSKLTAEMVSFFAFHDRYFEEIHRLIFVWPDYIVPIVLIYYSVVKRHGNDFFMGLKLSKISKKEMIFYIKISIILVIAILGLAILIEISPLNKYTPKSTPIIEFLQRGYLYMALFSFMAIIGPFQEELIFRGYIYQGLKRSFGTLTSAILVTVIFAGLHARQLGNSLILLIPILIGSIIFIIVRIKTDSLTKCVIVHQIYNTTLVILFWTFLLIFGFDSMKP
jgi:membrane protease YdiL (CAAX protease family)